MKSKPGDQAVMTWARLIRAQTLLLTEVHSSLKGAGLPPLEWYDVLLELHRVRDGGLRQFEIGDKIVLPKYNLSRLIDRLEREGLVKRHSCQEDGRGNVVRITAAGSRLLKQMWPVYGSAITNLLERNLAPEEISTLGELLNRLLKKLDHRSGGHTSFKPAPLRGAA